MGVEEPLNRNEFRRNKQLFPYRRLNSVWVHELDVVV